MRDYGPYNDSNDDMMRRDTLGRPIEGDHPSRRLSASVGGHSYALSATSSKTRAMFGEKLKNGSITQQEYDHLVTSYIELSFYLSEVYVLSFHTLSMLQIRQEQALETIDETCLDCIRCRGFHLTYMRVIFNLTTS